MGGSGWHAMGADRQALSCDQEERDPALGGSVLVVLERGHRRGRCRPYRQALLGAGAGWCPPTQRVMSRRAWGGGFYRICKRAGNRTSRSAPAAVAAASQRCSEG